MDAMDKWFRNLKREAPQMAPPEKAELQELVRQIISREEEEVFLNPSNAAQYDFIEGKVLEGEPRCVAMLGLSFKPGTSVMDKSHAFELVRRLRSRSIRVVAFDPIAQARVAARETFDRAITCCDTLAESLAAADTVVVCNPDPSFAGLATNVPADRRIVDPWGCVHDPHPGLIQSGRTPKGTSSGVRRGLQTGTWIETQAPDTPE